MTDKSQSLERGLAILEMLDGEQSPLGIREIARRMALSPPIVQRLVKSLHEAEFVAQDPETHRYTLGYRALSLGSSLVSEDNLISAAMPVLSRMTRDIEVNAFLSVVSGDKLVYVLALQSTGPIAIRSRSGTQAAFHSTAMGKALLADLDAARVKALLGSHPLERLTDRTTTDHDALIAELALVRQKGYATSVGENLPGVEAAGACVRNATGIAIAAISAAFAPQLQPNLQLQSVAEATLQAAAQISLSLGCPRDKLGPAGLLRAVGGNVA